MPTAPHPSPVLKRIPSLRCAVHLPVLLPAREADTPSEQIFLCAALSFAGVSGDCPRLFVAVEPPRPTGPSTTTTIHDHAQASSMANTTTMLTISDLTAIDVALLEEYRVWAFPSGVANENHDPYFPLYEPVKWVTVDGFALFMKYGADTAAGKLLQPATTSMSNVIGFKSCILPSNLVTHPFFAFERKDNWLSAVAFAAFIRENVRYPACVPNITVTKLANGVERVVKNPPFMHFVDPRYVLLVTDSDSDTESDDSDDAVDLDEMEIYDVSIDTTLLHVKRKRE